MKKRQKSIQTTIKSGKNITMDTLRERSQKGNFDVIISDLKQGFYRDYTVEQACLYAGINKDTFYDWRKACTEFAHQMDMAKNTLKIIAKDNISGQIRRGDMKTTRWWLERRLKDEFSTRNESDIDITSNGSTLTNLIIE